MQLISNTIYFKEASLQKESSSFSINYLNSVGVTDPYIIYYSSKYGRDLLQILKSDSSDKESLINEHIRTQLKSLDVSSFLKKKNLSDPKLERDLQHWFNYILNENEIYKSNPAFQYVLLRELLNIKNSRQLLMEYDGEAIAKLFSFIGKNYDQRFNLKKEYNRISNEISLDTPNVANDSRGNAFTGWTLILGKDKDPGGFEKNCKLLNKLSKGRGWCTGELEYCEWYLESSDVYLYLENGIAEVSMPIGGISVQEIKGKDNEVPKKYAIEILKFIREKNLCFDYEGEGPSHDINNGDYESLLNSLSPEVESSEAIMDCKLRFSTGFKLPDGVENPRLKDAERTGRINRLNVDPSSYHSIPQEEKNDEDILKARFNGYINILEKGAVDSFHELPSEIRDNLRAIEAYKVGICKSLREDPLVQYKVPTTFKDDKDVKEAIIEGYVRQLKVNPHYGVSDRLLDDPRIKEAHIQGYINSISEHPKILSKVPYSYKTDPVIWKRLQEAYMEGWEHNLDYYLLEDLQTLVAHSHLERLKIPNKLFIDNPNIKNKYIKLCCRILKFKPSEYKYVSDVVKNDQIILDAQIDGWARLASRLRLVPIEFFEHPKVQQACIEGWGRQIQKDYRDYSNLPHYLEDNEYLKELGVNGFLSSFDKSTSPDHFDSVWNQIPFNLRSDPRLQQRLQQREQQNRQAFTLMDIRF